MKKWTSLEHNGPAFPAEYTPKNFKIKVKGVSYTLPALAEEYAYYWSQKHATDYVKDPVFQTNFFKGFAKLLPPNIPASNFPADWDFSELVTFIEKDKEKKKTLSKEQKKLIKQEKADKNEKLGCFTFKDNLF
jgi:DNA topoisomerase-1